MSILGGVAGSLAGGNIGRAVVSLVLDTTGYNAQLEKTKVETAAATDTAGAATSKFSGIATAAYAIAGVAALDFAKSAIASAEEHAQVMAALTAQVGDNTQAFEDQATALQNVSGYQDEAILSADTILSRYKLTGEQVRSVIPSLLDLARVQGITVPDAANQFGKAVLGNTRALKALGIGSEEFVVTGNRAADAAVLVGLLNDKIGGQAAAYAQTLSGKMEILAAKFDDLKEAVGGPLISELTQLADQLTILVDVGGQFADVIGRLGADIPGGATAVNLLHDAMMPLGVVADYNTKVLGFFGDALGISTDNTDGLTTAADGATPALGGMTQASYDAAAAAGHLTDAQKTLKDSVQSAGEGILSLTTTVKDTFNISVKEEEKGFAQMLQAAVRFQADMKKLERLHLGLDKADTVAFENFMADQGPGFVDTFVNASAAKQKRWVSDWQKSTSAVTSTLKGVGKQMDDLNNKQVTVRVNSSQLDAASQRASNLQQTLNRFA